MKKTVKATCMIMFMITVFLMTACGGRNRIEGTWRLDHINMDGEELALEEAMEENSQIRTPLTGMTFKDGGIVVMDHDGYEQTWYWKKLGDHTFALYANEWDTDYKHVLVLEGGTLLMGDETDGYAFKK